MTIRILTKLDVVNRPKIFPDLRPSVRLQVDFSLTRPKFQNQSPTHPEFDTAKMGKLPAWLPNSDRKETAFMATGGPWYVQDANRERQLWYDWAKANVPGITPESFLIAFEVSDDGYHHLHMAIKAGHPIRLTKRIIMSMKKIITDHWDGSGTRQPNNRFHYVPINSSNQKQAAALGGRFGILRKYITDPHKSKMTDDGVLEFEAHDIVNANLAHIRSLRGDTSFQARFSCILARLQNSIIQGPPVRKRKAKKNNA